MRKTLNVFFVLIFLLSLGSLGAHAQTQKKPTAVTYVPLLSPKRVSSLPVEFQSRQAFETLAPQLQDAQAKGQIVGFEPEFSFGFVKVEYPTGFNLASALAITPQTAPPVFDTTQAVLAYTQVHPSLRGASSGRSIASGNISIPISSSCFNAGSMGADNFYRAYLFDPGGRLMATSDGYADSDGYFNTCFSGIWSYLMPGYNFSLNIFDPSGITFLQNYSTNIPRLSVSSIDLSKKIVTGVAPANSQLDAGLYHPYLDASDNGEWTDKAVVASSKGTWQVNFNPSAMRGGDQLEIDWSVPASAFYSYRYLWAPYAYCRLGGNYCGVYGMPGKSAKVSVLHAKKTYKASGQFSVWGYFSASVIDALAEPIFLAAGDKVTATGAKTYYLPALTAQPDYVTDSVSGVAPAGKYFEVDLDVYDFVDGWWNGDWNWVGSDALGNYSADFSSSFDILPTDRLMTYLYYHDPITGNETYYVNYIYP